MELIRQVCNMLLYKLNHGIELSLLRLSRCNLCQQPLKTNLLLCQYCLADLPVLHYPDNHFDLLHWPAIHTLLKKKTFDQLISLTPYVWPIDYWLKQLKYQYKFELAHGLAGLMAYHLEAFFQQHNQSELTMTSVPTDISRWQQRGYNPAHLVAKYLAKATNIDYQPSLLRRVKTSSSQVGKTGAQRRRDLKGAFEVVDDASLPRHIILFDDVITTGSTINEISRLLKKQGVNRITVLTLAIVLPR